MDFKAFLVVFIGLLAATQVLAAGPGRGGAGGGGGKGGGGRGGGGKGGQKG